MKIIEKGHKYELKNEDKSVQVLAFIRKIPIHPNTGQPGGNFSKLMVLEQGTTNEEVLKVMIDRMKFLDGIISCKENRLVIRHLETALEALERRTAERKKRKVEGTNKA